MVELQGAQKSSAVKNFADYYLKYYMLIAQLCLRGLWLCQVLF